MRGPSLIFVAPALIVFLVVVVYAGAYGVYGAFTNWSGLKASRSFVGLTNIRQLFKDAESLAALRNTLLLAVFITVLQNLFGLLLAMALEPKWRGRTWFRVLFFAPALLAPLAAAYLWRYIYAEDGLLNSTLRQVGLVRLTRDWLGDPSTALWCVGFVVVWQYCGLSMIIYLAGLQSIPSELVEAASLDGAGKLQIPRYVKLPLLRPAFLLSVVLATIGSLKLFDQVYVLTGGGPGTATQTLSTELYEQAFKYGAYGYASAIALALAVITIAAGAVQLKALRHQSD
jgi:raffinose/stachyose/melibiose transport system permease protein